jgi:hypothetical protein
MKLYEAYLMAFRSGEIAAMFGRELDDGIAELARKVDARDRVDTFSNEVALYDAYAAGRDGVEPMTEEQVECHYD